jgi:aspartyl-tRNA(Asn)/glutamyl-tRNA(Gln) amidotransferase subunit B
LIGLIDQGDVNFSAASQHLLPVFLKGTQRTAQELARELNLIQDRSEGTIGPLIDQVIKEFPLKVEEYHNGKKGILAMFMGEVMKRSKGKADPKLANEMLIKKLSKK